MIINFKKFKIFENYAINHELVTDYIGSDYAYEYYDKNFLIEYDREDIINIIRLSPNLIDIAFDIEKYSYNMIREESANGEIINYDDESDYIDYLTEHMTTDKENDIIKYYCENNDDDMLLKSDTDGIVSIDKENNKIIINNDGDDEEYDVPDDFDIVVEDDMTIESDDILAKKSKIEYDYTMLSELDIYQLRDIINDFGEVSEFIEFVNKNKYEGKSFLEILDDENGGISNYSDLFYDDGNAYYTPESFYDRFAIYINPDTLIKYFKRNEDIDRKCEWVESQIENSIELQKYLIDNADDPNDDVSILLFDLFKDKNQHDNDISDEYDFQKKYIEQYVLDNGYDDDTEEQKSKIISEALENIDNNFILDSDIKKEYNKYMFSVDANKYNM